MSIDRRAAGAVLCTGGRRSRHGARGHAAAAVTDRAAAADRRPEIRQRPERFPGGVLFRRKGAGT
jgi:hypothetical protein